MLDVVQAVLPVFLVILLGAALKARQFVPDSFWVPAERLTYFVTFPALLTSNLAKAEMGGLAWAPLMMAGAIAILVTAGTMLLVRTALLRGGITNAPFTSVFQGAVRPNTYIGLALAAGLYGPHGVTLTAICIAVVVPLVNVLAVSCLVRYVGSGSGSGWMGVLRGLVTNPLLMACVLGILLNVSGIGLPPVVGPLMEILGRAALPIGLLAVGAGLTLGAITGAKLALAASTVAKLLLVPIAALAAAVALGLTGPTLAVAVLYGALPCSASSYVLARQMGGDAPLMAGIITTQTLLAALTIPLWVILVEALGP